MGASGRPARGTAARSARLVAVSKPPPRVVIGIEIALRRAAASAATGAALPTMPVRAGSGTEPAVGRFGDEAVLLSLAGLLEQARPWAGRLPPGLG
jgi:hypothetical protein